MQQGPSVRDERAISWFHPSLETDVSLVMAGNGAARDPLRPKSWGAGMQVVFGPGSPEGSQSVAFLLWRLLPRVLVLQKSVKLYVVYTAIA